VALTQSFGDDSVDATHGLESGLLKFQQGPAGLRSSGGTELWVHCAERVGILAETSLSQLGVRDTEVSGTPPVLWGIPTAVS
jgi:hypothetical protein